MKPKNSFDKAALTVVIFCAVLCIAFFPFLSDNIAIQWSGRNVSNTANRLFIFVLPLISLALYLARFSLGSVFLAKRGINFGKEKLISYIALWVDIILFSGTAVIILFDTGIYLPAGAVFPLEIIIGVILGFKIIRIGL